MRIAAIIYIILSVVANFIFNSLPIFALAIFSFPVLLWVLLKRKMKSPQFLNEENKTKERSKSTNVAKQTIE